MLWYNNTANIENYVVIAITDRFIKNKTAFHCVPLYKLVYKCRSPILDDMYHLPTFAYVAGDTSK